MQDRAFHCIPDDVASTILRGRLADPLRSRLTGHSLCITFVTLGEMTMWRVLRDWGPRRLATFKPTPTSAAGGGRSCRAPARCPAVASSEPTPRPSLLGAHGI